VDFKLTEEQQLIRKNMREFADKYVEPIAAEIDENSRHPAELFQKLAEGGWMGMPIPIEYGGAGTDYLTHILAVEELSRSCSSTGFSVASHVIVAFLPLLYGTEEQKKKYLVPLAEGKHMSAFALTEPGAGTDVMAATSHAVLDGNEYVINGTKTFITNGPLAETYFVVCWTDKAAGRKGMSAFIIPKGTPDSSRESTSRRWVYGPPKPPRLFSRTVAFRGRACWDRQVRPCRCPWPSLIRGA
jgi:butyryl-CoA dehydrogenase